MVRAITTRRQLTHAEHAARVIAQARRINDHWLARARAARATGDLEAMRFAIGWIWSNRRFIRQVRQGVPR